jgi:hypothetical protein
MVAALLGLAACKRAAEMAASPVEAEARAGAPTNAGDVTVTANEQSGTAASPRPDAGRKLVKTVDLEMRVADTAATAEKLRALAGSMGGFVSALSAERRNDLLYYTLTLRVPVERLEEALRRVKALGERIEREAIRTEDVTQQWVDLEARLTTLRATENELRQLLAEARQRRQNVEDIMAVYTRLLEIRTSIEQLQAQHEALRGLTSLSTLNVQLVSTEAARPIVDVGWSPSSRLRQSFRTLISALQGLADIAIVLLVVVLPIALLIALPIWVLARLWRRARRRRPAAEG